MTGLNAPDLPPIKLPVQSPLAKVSLSLSAWGGDDLLAHVVVLIFGCSGPDEEEFTVKHIDLFLMITNKVMGYPDKPYYRYIAKTTILDIE